jgi:hypothetical protein
LQVNLHTQRKSVSTFSGEDHLLPTGFTRIRHYGFLAGKNRARNLDTIRALLGASPPPVPEPEAPAAARCPTCGGALRRGCDVAPWSLVAVPVSHRHKASTGPPEIASSVGGLLELARAVAA